MVAVASALLTGAAMALTLAQPASAQAYCDVEDPPPICDPGDPYEPPDPSYAPVLNVDGAQQTTSRNGVHVWGWTADDDAPTTSLTVNISYGGISAGSVTANVYRADVANVYPKYGASHGFDVMLPAAAAGTNICVTAVSIGGGSNTTRCRQTDDVASFEAYSISYDTAHGVLTNTTLDQLDYLSTRNETTVQQSTEISGSKTVSSSEGWSDTTGVRVSVSTSLKVGIPLFADGKITVTAEGSYSFTQNGSTTRSQTFSWRQPVIVPAMSMVNATVAVSHSTISVPYTLK